MNKQNEKSQIIECSAVFLITKNIPVVLGNWFGISCKLDLEKYLVFLTIID